MAMRRDSTIFFAASFAGCVVSVACLSAFAAPPDDGSRLVQARDTALRIEVDGVDDPARRAMLVDWAEEAARATVLPSGRFPLASAQARIVEIDSRDPSPVPWGQTRRDDDVAVLLFVRRGADRKALRADWTAVHEFAHLAHPYLGDRGRWLAEGLASYQQNVLRARAGLTTPEDAWTKLDAGFRRGEAAGDGVPLGRIGHGRGATMPASTMRVYWAGAAYWLEMDLRLRREHASSLQAVLDGYARCCLDGTAHVAPEDFVAALDRVAGTDLFVRRYRDYADGTTFPSVDDDYAALGIAHDGAGLRFSDDAPAAALRAAIMGVPASKVSARGRTSPR